MFPAIRCCRNLGKAASVRGLTQPLDFQTGIQPNPARLVAWSQHVSAECPERYGNVGGMIHAFCIDRGVRLRSIHEFTCQQVERRTIFVRSGVGCGLAIVVAIRWQEYFALVVGGASKIPGHLWLQFEVGSVSGGHRS